MDKTLICLEYICTVSSLWYNAGSCCAHTLRHLNIVKNWQMYSNF